MINSVKVVSAKNKKAIGGRKVERLYRGVFRI